MYRLAEKRHSGKDKLSVSGCGCNDPSEILYPPKSSIRLS